jgi:hypothetical protein
LDREYPRSEASVGEVETLSGRGKVADGPRTLAVEEQKRKRGAGRNFDA